MIAKKPPRRADGGSSFVSLGQYICGDKIDPQTGEVTRHKSDVSVYTNCLSIETAGIEMAAVANENPRVQSPVYHCVISWREGENPTDQQMFEAAKKALEALGMADHQHVFAVHRDTENPHVHIMCNRVNPVTYRAVDPKNDHYTLDKTMRVIELSQGWQHDNGPYVVEAGKVIKRPPEQQPAQSAKLPEKAQAMERLGGNESLITYAKEALSDALEAIKTGDWQVLHASLKTHGLEIREAGQGFRIYSATDAKQPPIKASAVDPALGGGRLKKQLGEFKPAIRAVQIQTPKREYSPLRERDPAVREAQKAARAAARADLKSRFETEKKRIKDSDKLANAELSIERKSRLKTIADHARARRERVRTGSADTATKKALYSLIAMEAVRARESLKTELDAKRRVSLIPNYREWVAEQAAHGDQAAISQVRGWLYADKRAKKAHEIESANALKIGALIGQPGDEPHVLKLDDMQYLVNRKTGDVEYLVDGKRGFIDRGRVISFDGTQSDRALEKGLMLAMQKQGRELEISGNAAFKRQIAELAAKRGLRVTFKDRETENLRQQFAVQLRGQKAPVAATPTSKNSR